MPPKQQFKLRAMCDEPQFKSVYRYLDERTVYCKVCDKTVNCGANHERQRMLEHRGSYKHKELSSNRTMVQQSTSALIGKNKHLGEFNYHLVRCFIEANIPLFKLNSPSVKQLFEVHCGKSIYDRRHIIDKYSPILMNECIDDIRRYIGNTFVYFIIDETPDTCHLSVVNVLVGSLTGTYSRPLLLKEQFFDVPVDSSIITQVLINSCIRLWPDGIKYEKCWLIVTDAAAYMKKAFNENLKPLFSSSIHITCLAHGIHNLCEKVSDRYDKVEKFVTCVSE